MKKILIALIILLIVFNVGVYIFIPSELKVSAITKITAPANGVYRCISNESTWQKWLKQSKNSAQQKYSVGNSFVNTADIIIHDGNDTIRSVMSCLRLAADTMVVDWKFSRHLGLNPFDRISEYNRAVRIKNNMDSVLKYLKVFASKEENIYGFTIHESSTKDTLLISIKTNLAHYPSTTDIYSLIDELRNYAQKSGATITGYPMYNITKLNADSVRLMVATPVNKELKKEGAIVPVHMVPGRFIVAQISGGEATVRNALNEMPLYFAEHNRTAMAITFSYLITDRRQQPDTLKWITKIYAPVF